MSFVEQEDVLGVCEELFSDLTEQLSEKRVLKKPWPRIRWQEAMDRYGSDKPDLRYDLLIVDVSEIVATSPFQVFSGAIERGGVVRGVRAPGAATFTRRQIDELTQPATANGTRAYDAVASGAEPASGSRRVHRADTQSRLFELLWYAPERIQSNFGHILRAFQYAAPPHGGIAPGIDRIVSMLADEDSIREVIPFPKHQSAQDLMMVAPPRVPPEQLEDLHLRVVEPALVPGPE